jgi:hypothetical protein
MLDLDHFVREMVATDRDWLKSQPGMQDWNAGCRRLGTVIMAQIREFKSSLETTRSAVSSAQNPATRTAAPSDSAITEETSEVVLKVWHVWKHHWKDAIRAASGQPQDGLDVLRQIKAGRGFRERRGNETTMDSDQTAATRRFGRLGGDPINDTLLVDAVVIDRDARAIQRLRDQYRALALQIARQKGFQIASASSRSSPDGDSPVGLTHERILDSDWWDMLIADLVSSGALNEYSGESGLSVYLGVSITRKLMRPPRHSLRVPEELQHLEPSTQWEALGFALSPERLAEVECALDRWACENQRTLTPDLRVRRAGALLTADEFQGWQSRLSGIRGQRLQHLSRPEPAKNPVEVAECRGILTRLFQEAINRLASRERQVLLHSLQGQMGKAIAGLLGIHPGNVSRTLQSTIQSLRETMQNVLSDESDFATDCRECVSLLVVGGMDQLAETLIAALDPTPVSTSAGKTGRGAES